MSDTTVRGSVAVRANPHALRARSHGFRRMGLLGSTALVGIALTAGVAQADEFTANSTASLIAAINSANANPGADTIRLTGDVTLSGLLPTLSDTLVINGGGFSLSGDGAYRIFYVDAGTNAIDITNFGSLSGGQASGGAGGTLAGGGLGAGGAIFVNSGVVNVSQVSFENNAATGGAGGTASGTAGGGGGGGLGGAGGSGSAAGSAGGGGGFSGGGGGGGGSSTQASYYANTYSPVAAGAGGAGVDGGGGAGGVNGAGAGGFAGGSGGAANSATSYAPTYAYAAYYAPYFYNAYGSYTYCTGGYWNGSCWGGYTTDYYSYTVFGGYYLAGYYQYQSGDVVTQVAVGGGGGGGGAAGGGAGAVAPGAYLGGGGGGGGGLTGLGGTGSGGGGGLGGGGGGGDNTNNAGGTGGLFGGGGGSVGTGAAGAGGFGGGGGGVQQGQAGTGGAGGFGAGGGSGGTDGVNGLGGTGGAGASTTSGGGGAGLGGAIFVRSGSLTLGAGVSSSGSAATGGLGGAGAGSDLFLTQGTNTTLAPGAGNTIALTGSIGDDSSGTLAGGTGPGAAITIGAGTVSLTGANTYSGGTTVNTGGTLTGTTTGIQGNIVNDGAVVFDQAVAGGYSGDLSGTGGVVLAGTGTITLTGANSYSGGTTVNAGGTLAGTTTGIQGNIVNDGAVVFDQSVAGGYSGELSGTGGVVLAGTGTITLTGANSYSGGTTVNAGGTLTGTTTGIQGNIVNDGAVVFDQSVAGGYSGELSGTGGVVLAGTGTITLTGANSYSGGTTVNADGTLAGTTTGIQGNIVNDGAVVFDQSVAGGYSGELSGIGGLTVAGTGAISLTGANSYSGGTTINTGGTLAGTTTGIQGNILNNGVLIFDQAADGDYAGLLSGTGGVVLNGAGAIALTNTSNTFSGGVIVNSGVLRITSDAALGSGAITLNGGGLDLTLAQLAPGRQLITLGQVQQVAVDTGDFVFTGGIVGSGIEKVGLGTLTFNYDNSGFSGDIYVNGGTIRALTAQSFGSATIHMVDPNIQYSATGSYASNIVLEVAAPSSVDPSTLTVDAGIVATISGSITQTANGDTVQPLVIAGSGTLVLTNAANSWNGSTTINSGATLQGTAATISGGNIVSNGTLALNQGVDGTFGLDISGTGGVTSMGPAELTLSGTNTYSGRTQINAGTLIAGGGSAIGDASAVTVADGAVLSLTASEAIGSLAGAGTVDIGLNTLTVGGDNTSTEFSGSIIDPSAIAYVGSWNVADGPIWSVNPPTYTGQDAAALLFGGSAGDYRISTAGTSTTAITDTAWYNRYGGNPANFTELASNARIDTGGAGYNAQGDSSAYVGDHTSTPTFNFAFTGGQSLGGSLTHVGTGTLILSGTNTYTGDTVIQAGTLELRNGAAIANTGLVSIAAGGTLAVTNAETIGNLGGTGVTTLAANLTLASASGTYGGDISGVGGLILSGGSLTLDGTNTYSGATQIGTGALTASGGSAIGDFSAVSLAGGTLTLTASETIGSLSGTGTVQVSANTLTVGGDNTSTEFSGSIIDITPLTYVGMWDMVDGPNFNSNPLTYSAQEAAALLFGGPAGGYRISTAGTNTATITDTAWYTIYADGVYEVADDTHIDVGSPGYNTPGDYSAYVHDSNTPALNYAFTGGGQSLGGSLTHVGTGTLILSGTNTYTGTTLIQAGTLQLRGGSAIADTGLISIAAGGTLAVNTSETIGNLTGAGATTLAGILTLAAGSGTYGGNVSGAGTLTVAGGSLTLGGTLSNAGGLRLGGATTGMISATGVITAAATYGVLLDDGSSLTNRGSISGSSIGVLGLSGTFNVVNSGTIIGTNAAGVQAQGNLTLTNEAGGSISGRAGVYASGVGTVTNAAGATISAGALSNTVRLSGSGSSLTNAGSITGTTIYAGVFFDRTGTVTNQAGGVISNTGTAVEFTGAGSVLDNAGAISNTNTTSAVYFGSSGSVMNRADGVITSNSWAVQIVGDNGSVTNAGSITGQRGVHLNGANTDFDNSGSITGSRSGVVATGTSTITNALGGTITATTYRGVYSSGVGTTVDNAGLITGGDAGVYLDGINAALTNTGTIRLAGTTDPTVITGVYMSGAGSILTNSGTIESTLTDGRGVYLAGNTGAITNLSGGVISGNGTGAAIILTGVDSTVHLQSGSTVNGLIDASVSTGHNVLTVAGDLNGGYAGGTGADDVTLIGGMTVSGLIDGSSGTDALVLGGLSDGALDIGQTTGFESRTMDGDGIWTLSGVDGDAADWALNSGTLRLTGSRSVSDTAGILVNSGATLSIGDSEAINGLNGAGAVVIDADQFLVVGVNGTDSAFSGIISGAGGLEQYGAGSLTLYGVNTYTGDTRVDAGTLRLGASGVIADSSRLIVQSGATLDMQGFDETVAVAWLNGTVNNSISPPPSPLMGGTSGGPQAVILPTGTGTLTAADYYLDGATINTNLGTGNLYNTGGVSILNGTAAAGLVSVQAGTLRLGESDRLADTAILSVSANATLDLQGFDETVATAYLNGSLYGANIPFSPLVDGDSKSPELVAWNPGPVGTGTLTAADYYLNGADVFANLGTGNLFNTGGYSTLYGTAAAGLVSVQAGTLLLGVSNRLADTATLSVSSGATLDLRGNDETVGLALINGSLNSSLPNPALPLAAPTLDGVSPQSGMFLGTGTLTAAEYQLNGATVNANLGTGNLFNTGGVSILNGTAATGQVVVQAGTLRLGTSERLADTANLSVASGATLDLQGHDETVALALLNGTLNSTVSVPDDAQVIPALGFSTKGTDGPLTIPAPSGTGTLTAAQYQLNGATINGNLGTGSLFNSGGVSTLNGTSAASSVVVQAGTLVLGASDRLADTATVSVSSGATLNLNAFNDTVQLALLNGTLAGTGTLGAVQYQLVGATVNANLGAGTLFTLGGVSTLTGSAAASQVNVNAGTLRLGGSDRLADTALVSVSTGATLDVNSRTDTIGSLFGTGAVAISSGRLTLGGADSAFGGSLSGSGSLVHTSGLFTLGGNHTLQSISNTGGELRFLAATSGNVAVSGGSLTGAGTIGGALTVSGGATLSPGLGGSNGLGTFAVGSLTLNGGTLALDVLGTAGGNLTDRLVVSGTANLTGGILAPTFQAPAGGYDFLTRYQFLTAGQRVGTFSNGAAFTAAPGQSTLFWRVRYDLAPNAAVLELRSLVDFTPGLTGSDNQTAVGQALTGGQLEASDDWAGVLGLLADLTPAQQQATFDSLGGEALADLSSSLLAANDAFAGAVREAGAARIPGANPLNFASAFSFVGGRDGAAAMVTSVLDAFDPSAGTGSAEGGWISVHASDVDLQGKQGQADLQTRLNAFVGGYAVGTGDFVLGAAAGASRMEGDVSGRQSSYESDLLHAAGYARYDNGRWAADLTASAYGGEIDSRRIVSVGAFTGQATGRTHGEGQSLSASVARRFVHEDGSAISVGLMQTLSRSTIDAFTETGAGGLSLEVADQERNWQTTQLNLRGTQDYQLSGQPLRMYGGLGVLITTGDREASSDMRFSGAAAGFGGFTVEGAGATPLAGTAELGFEYQPREGLTLSTGYRAVFSQRLNDNQIGARMSVQW